MKGGVGMTKVPVSNWRELPYEKWSVTTVRAFLKERHEAIYGIPYVTRSHAMEGRLIKTMLTDHGAEVVRTFAEVCFVEYKPNQQYPGLNFAFMFSYMRERTLPKVLLKLKTQEQAVVQSAETGEEEKIDSDWW